MATTKIEWTDATWNPTSGCDKVSPGCDNCYALQMAGRLKAMGSAKYQRDGRPETSGPGFGLTVHPDVLEQPLRWRKPRRVFVNSMSDLFHPQVPVEFIAEVFGVMAVTPQHTYQILTKRPKRMRSLLTSEKYQEMVMDGMQQRGVEPTGMRYTPDGRLAAWRSWPLPNVWLGTSVEDQRWAGIRVPALLATPAAVRFLSVEPLLGPVTLIPEAVGGYPESDEWARRGPHYRGVDWVIVGGESGPGARPMHPQWARDLRDQCVAAGVPFFFKQWGEWRPARGVERFPRHDFWESDPPRVTCVYRVGKKRAGRELDGRTWDEYPEVADG